MIRSVDGVCVDGSMTEVYLYILDVEVMIRDVAGSDNLPSHLVFPNSHSCLLKHRFESS